MATFYAVTIKLLVIFQFNTIVSRFGFNCEDWRNNLKGWSDVNKTYRNYFLLLLDTDACERLNISFSGRDELDNGVEYFLGDYIEINIPIIPINRDHKQHASPIYRYDSSDKNASVYSAWLYQPPTSHCRNCSNWGEVSIIIEQRKVILQPH
jgi:hypothetical protein